MTLKVRAWGFGPIYGFGDQHHLLQEQMFDAVPSAMFTLLLGGHVSFGKKEWLILGLQQVPILV